MPNGLIDEKRRATIIEKIKISVPQSFNWVVHTVFFSLQAPGLVGVGGGGGGNKRRGHEVLPDTFHAA